MKLRLPKVRGYIMFIGISFALMGILALYHESVHQIIYEDYGIDSHIEWFSHFPDIATVTEPINSTDCPADCKLANNINESVGYHLIPIFFLLMFGMFIIIMILEKFVENTEGFLSEFIFLLENKNRTQEKQ